MSHPSPHPDSEGQVFDLENGVLAYCESVTGSWFVSRSGATPVEISARDLQHYIRSTLAGQRAAQSQRGRWFPADRIVTPDGATFSATANGVELRGAREGAVLNIPIDSIARLLEVLN